MTHGREKSDSPIVPVKPPNKVASATAEPVEEGGGGRGAERDLTRQTSSGSRMGSGRERGRPDALDARAAGIAGTKVNRIPDADIAGFFDTLSHDRLIRFVEHRIGDRRAIRRIRKWRTAGVMEDGVVAATTAGTPQGAVASPLLANIYLHYVFGLWGQRWRNHHARGDIIIVGDADDFVVGFAHEAEAGRFPADLRQRREELALSLHPDKTRLIGFGRRGGCRAQEAGSWQAGDVHVPWLDPYLRPPPPRRLPAQAEVSPRPQGQSYRRSRRNCGGGCTSRSRARGSGCGWW